MAILQANEKNVPSGNVSQHKEEEMQTILISILTDAITTKIIVTYYFKKIDGYVEKMCEMTLKSNEKTVAIILHKLQENFELED